MKNRADFLRTRIQLYRTYLRESIPAEEATRYLREIQRDEAELKTLEEKLAVAATPFRGQN